MTLPCVFSGDLTQHVKLHKSSHRFVSARRFLVIFSHDSLPHGYFFTTHRGPVLHIKKYPCKDICWSPGGLFYIQRRSNCDAEWKKFLTQILSEPRPLTLHNDQQWIWFFTETFEGPFDDWFSSSWLAFFFIYLKKARRNLIDVKRRKRNDSTVHKLLPIVVRKGLLESRQSCRKRVPCLIM